MKRVLRLRDLVVYGMIILQVVGPLPTFGLLEQRSNGHSVLTAAIAFLPMLITAVSYGRLAGMFPVAGSAYTYVGRGLNSHLGFLTGWAMFLDYWMILLISAEIPSLALARLAPILPLPVLNSLILAVMTLLNLCGIQTTLRANKLLLVGSSFAVLLFVALSIHHIVQLHGVATLASLNAIYDPATFHLASVIGGVSLAAITYIGFDGLTTLSEDAVNPRRDMARATALVVSITGLLSVVELYFLHSVLPNWRATDPNTSYLDAMAVVGGSALFALFFAIMSISQFGSGLSVQASVARLLYGMGRDGVLPKRIFGQLHPTKRHPSRNILAVGILAWLGTLVVPFEQAVDFLNFGAFMGFMGVNAAAIACFFVRPAAGHRRRLFSDCIVPAAGFVGCFIFWIGLPRHAQIFGGLWLLAGFLFLATKTRGFRKKPILFDFAET